MVLSSLINPYEEQLSYELYEQKIPDCTLDEFESFFAKTLKPNALIMSLKLSKNQERLIAFLKSKAIDDELFLKLIKLYHWKEEGIFDSDENRDIALAFINRFFTKRLHFNHNDIAHSPATLLDIALTSSNPKALEALFSMPNHSVNIKQNQALQPKNIKESLALNPNTPKELQRSLLNLRNPRIDTFLALNPSLEASEQEEIFARGNEEPLLALSKNPNVSDELFNKLLEQKEPVVTMLLHNQLISPERFKKIPKHFYPILATSSTIESIKEKLIGISKEIDLLLLANPTLEAKELEELYKKYQEEAIVPLASNPNTPSTLLEEFYKLNQEEITLLLASNPNIPLYIMDELYEKNKHPINRALAQNPALKDEYIEFFKLDNELITLMSKIPTLREKIAKKREYV